MPKTLRIGPYDYTVDCSEKGARESQDFTNNNGTVGYHFPRCTRITILPELSESNRRGVLFHEVIHACASVAWLNPTEKVTGEEWNSRIYPILLDTLQRNPSLVAYLCG